MTQPIQKFPAVDLDQLDADHKKSLSIEKEEELQRLNDYFERFLTEQNTDDQNVPLRRSFVGAQKRKRQLPGLTRQNFVCCLVEALDFAEHAANILFDCLYVEFGASETVVTFEALLTAIVTQTRVNLNRVLELADERDIGLTTEPYPRESRIVERFGHRKNVEVLAVTDHEWISVGVDGVMHLWPRYTVHNVKATDHLCPRPNRSVLDPSKDPAAGTDKNFALPAIIQADTGLPDDAALDANEKRRRVRDFMAVGKAAENPLPSQRPPAPVLPTGIALPPKVDFTPDRFKGGMHQSATDAFLNKHTVGPHTPLDKATPRPAHRPHTSTPARRQRRLLSDTLSPATPPLPRTPGPPSTFRPTTSTRRRRPQTFVEEADENEGVVGHSILNLNCYERSLQTWCTTVHRLSWAAGTFLCCGTLTGFILILDTDNYTVQYKIRVGRPVVSAASFVRSVSATTDVAGRRRASRRKSKTPARKPGSKKTKTRGRGRPKPRAKPKPSKLLPGEQRLVICGDISGTVRFIDLSTFEIVATYHAHGSDWVTTIKTYEDDGQPVVISGGGDGSVVLWDQVSLTPARVLRGHRGGVTSVDYDEGSKTIVSCSLDRTIRLWSPFGDVSTGVISVDNGTPLMVVLVEALNSIICVFSERVICTYSLASLQRVQMVVDRTRHTPINRITAAAFDRRAGIIITAGSFIRLWPLAALFNEANSGIPLASPDQIKRVVISPGESDRDPDNDGLVTPGRPHTPPRGGRPPHLGRGDPTRPRPAPPLPTRPHESPVVAVVELNPALELEHVGTVLCSVSADGCSCVWSLDRSNQLRLLRQLELKHDHDITAVAVDRHGRKLISGDVKGNVSIWEPFSGTKLVSLASPNCGEVASLFIDSDKSEFPFVVGFWAGVCKQYHQTVASAPGGPVTTRQLLGHTGDIVAVDKLVSPGDIPHSPRKPLPPSTTPLPAVVTTRETTRQPFLLTASSDGVLASWDPFRGRLHLTHVVEPDALTSGGLVDLAVLGSDLAAVLTQQGKVHIVAPLVTAGMVARDVIEGTNPTSIAALPTQPPTLAAVTNDSIYIFSIGVSGRATGGGRLSTLQSRVTLPAGNLVTSIAPLVTSNMFMVGFRSGHLWLVPPFGDIIQTSTVETNLREAISPRSPRRDQTVEQIVPVTPARPATPYYSYTPEGNIQRTPLGRKKLYVAPGEEKENRDESMDGSTRASSEAGTEDPPTPTTPTRGRPTRPKSSHSDLWMGTRPAVHRLVLQKPAFDPLTYGL